MLRPASRLARTLTASGLGPLLIRGIVGVVFAFHGAQKLFGWFDGGGIAGTAEAFKGLGIPLPTLNAYLAGGAECFGGLLLILGLATRPAALILAFTMAVAIVTVHPDAFSLQNNGMEYALTLGVVSLGLALHGAGVLSVDALLHRKTRE